MRLRSLMVGTICIAVAAPTTAHAQTGDDGRPLDGNALQRLLEASWNISAHAGYSTSGRFLLQRPDGLAGERDLRREGAFDFGAGFGVDILPRSGFRANYTFSSSDLEYSTDIGDGSEVLDVDDVGGLDAHLASVEAIRYMLPARSVLTPYVSAGFAGTWWVLDETPLILSAGSSSTQFRWGALGSFGLQLRLGDNFHTRAELSTSTVRNPFTGNESYQALGGSTVDEPTRVNRTDFRVIGVYYFDDLVKPRTVVRRAKRGRRSP